MNRREAILSVVNSGVGRVYLLATAAAIVAIGSATGRLGAGILFGGWVGLFTAIAANALTDGHLMEDSWIARRKI